MRACNEAHEVREFVLIYPEPDDARSVVWHRYDERRGRYRVLRLPANRRYRSAAIPGLEVEVLPPAEWTPGRKVRVWFQGVEFREAAAEAARADQERARADQERAAREQAHQARLAAEHRADQERAARDREVQRAARLAERLRALGIDPDTV